MARYNHAYTIAFSLVSGHAKGEDVTPAMLRQAVADRAAALGESEEWHEAAGAPFDTYQVDESLRPRLALYKGSFWASGSSTPATWYFDGLGELCKAIDAAHKHGVVRSQIEQVDDYPDGDCISDASEVLAWFKSSN